MKHTKKLLVLSTISFTFVLILFYLFKIHCSDQESYHRYSIKYYLLTPEPLKSISDIITSKQKEYTSSPSDGPSPAVTTVIFLSVEKPSSYLNTIANNLKSHSVVVVPSNIPVSQEPISKLSATVDIISTSNDMGDIRVTLYESNYDSE